MELGKTGGLAFRAKSSSVAAEMDRRAERLKEGDPGMRQEKLPPWWCGKAGWPSGRQIRRRTRQGRSVSSPGLRLCCAGGRWHRSLHSCWRQWCCPCCGRRQQVKQITVHGITPTHFLFMIKAPGTCNSATARKAMIFHAWKESHPHFCSYRQFEKGIHSLSAIPTGQPRPPEPNEPPWLHTHFHTLPANTHTIYPTPMPCDAH